VPLLAGDSFTIFTAATHNGSFNSIVGSPGQGLAYHFTNGILSVISTLTSYRTNIAASMSRDSGGKTNTVTITWPSTHTGWVLQVQTNTVDGSIRNDPAAWFDLPGSASTNFTRLTNPADRAMYFRLKNPTQQIQAASPSILTATAGNAQVSLSWTAPAYARSYNVKRATTSGGPYTTITNVPTTSVVDTGLINGTTYFYVVSALNYYGETANSAEANATPAAPAPPAAPTGLMTTAGDTVALLAWTPSAGATSYNVKRSTTSGGPYTTITNVTTTSVVDTGLTNGITYYYVVSALNTYGESVNSSPASATPAALPPAAPTGLTATACDAQASLSWTACLGATSYNVKRATTPGGPYTTIVNITATSFVNSGLTNGTAYYYVVTALNADGESAHSSEKSATPGLLPLVYSIENTGTSCAAPPLPPVPPPGSFTYIEPLPDPFTWASDPLNTGGTRSTAAADWKCHRAQVKAQIEKYEIGIKPVVDPANIFASYSSTVPNVSGTLTVIVTNNNKTLTLSCAISIPPTATAPYPIVIGMNSANGSLPAQDFITRGIVTCTYSHDQVTTYNSPSNTDPYYQLYGPALNVDNTGQYSAWAWGVSRIIDGLQKVTNSLPIDLNHICVTGCSYAGKMALFSGAFDERVALTVAQESGGGGDTSWRYSATEPVGSVEGLAQTSSQWFEKAMFQFGGTNVSYLPEDHHQLMAMCAPRALYCTGNTDYTWLSNPSAFVCGMACARIYETLCIGDRFGINIDGGHQHCMFPNDQESDLGYFLDKFMKGQTNLTQTIRTAPASFSTIDYARWSAWWGTTNAVFP
jgi:fibronectin type 3 domain-containing protein